jgi:palmitoyl-protein thioesterase
VGWYDTFAERLGKEVGVYSKCVEVGWVGVLASLFRSMESQGELACAGIKADPHFKDGFQVVGLSQGGLIGRYVVENCPGAQPVEKLLTLGGPHMGVADFPGCGGSSKGFICSMIDFIVKTLVYTWGSQHFIGPAGYFRDPSNLNVYNRYSDFLPSLNNERGSDSSKLVRKHRIQSLELLYLGWFEDDEMVSPPESSMFSELLPNGTVLPMNQTSVYKDLGLDTLDSQGKIITQMIKGDHLSLNWDQMVALLVPMLKM